MVQSGVGTLVALGIRVHAIDSLYTLDVQEGIYLSVVSISDQDLTAIAQIASSAPEVERVTSGRNHLVNYVLPTQMYISEIPMELPPGKTFGHAVPPNRNPDLYKVIFTQAVFDGEGHPPRVDLLWSAVNKVPLAEVHLDLSTRKVVATFPPPAKPFYGNVQVPIF